MADKEKIKTILELFLAWNGETEAIDVANLDSAVEFIEESLQKEPTSENFENVAKEYGEREYPKLCSGCKHIPIDSFKVGAIWQKEQLLAKAVDGEVTYGKSLAIPSLGYRLDKEGLDFGDKVKVIIIKKD